MKLNEYKFFNMRFWLDFILPNRCAFCNKIIVWDKLCCENCEKDFPYIDVPTCPRCGKANCICENKISYDRCFSVGWYDKNMRNAVVRYKLQSPDNFAEFFADKLCKMIKSENLLFDIVTCTPMSKKSLKERGYNQASVLGKAVAKRLDAPFDDKILTKIDNNISQHSLSFEKRAENAKHMFNFTKGKDVKNKKILLVDDVITTGSTLNSCATILKGEGALSVVCATALNTKFLETV